MAEPVRSVQLTSQTGLAVASLATPSPFASIPCSAGPSRTNEFENCDSSYTTVACSVPHIFLRGSGIHHGPIPNDVHNDLSRRAPISSVQTMTQTDPITHRLASNAQAATSRNYKADLAGDLANMFKAKLGVDVGGSRLHQKPYPDDFDLVSYPVGWCVPNFIKFSGDDNKITWEHISQYVAQLGEASSSVALRVRLFSLSLTGPVFSWFSS
jgi:hypothetical protein